MNASSFKCFVVLKRKAGMEHLGKICLDDLEYIFRCRMKSDGYKFEFASPGYGNEIPVITITEVSDD